MSLSICAGETSISGELRNLPYQFAKVACLLAFGVSLLACDESAANAGSPQSVPATPLVPTSKSAQEFEVECNRCNVSCALPDADACYRLAMLYEGGQGIRQDRQRAKHLFERAAKAGHVQAKEQLRKSWGF